MKPGTPEWQRLVTASKVAAILGVSPWESQRSIWHKMRSDLPREESTEVQKRGHYLEPAILAWWRDQHPPTVAEKVQPEFYLGDWAAATPDMCVDWGTGPDADALVEAKSAAYDDDWGDPGTDVIPAYYLVQVYWQMHVSGIHRCYVPVIGPRLRFAEYVVEYDAAIGADLEARMRRFYDSLAGDPPPLDGSVATFDVIRKLHKDIERGLSVELTYDEALGFADAIHDEENSVRHARLMRSTVIDRMGSAQFAMHNGVKVARRQPRGDAVTFVPLAKHPNVIAEMENAS